MIQFENIAWQAKTFRLDAVSMHIPNGCYGVLMGRTGCGKTTLAEILCGLRKPLTGNVFLNGCNVTNLPPGQRGIGYVPQDGALFPTMSVRENLGFALRVRRANRSDISEVVDLLAMQLGIAKLMDRKPEHLSGGERQRVALGRALAGQPGALVLDEPLSALDDETREELVQLLKEVQKRLGITVLHITHNRSEAARLADKLFRLEDGCLAETPLKP